MEHISTSSSSDQGTAVWTSMLLIVLVIALVIIERWWHMGKLERLGYTGPPRNLLYGNLKELSKINGNFQDEWKQLIEKYGSKVGTSEWKSIGMYQGSIPTIVVTDPEVIKYIFIRNFDNFRNRPFTRFEHRRSVFSLRDDKWRSVRHTLTPTFSQAKMKLMSKTIYDVISTTLDIIEDHVKEKKPIDFYGLYHGLTMEVISKCALAINVDSQKNPNHPLLVNCKTLVNSFKVDAIRRMIIVLFPSLALKIHLLLRRVLQWMDAPGYILQKNVKQVIDIRRHSKGKRTVDTLQLMMEAAQLVDTDNTEHTHSTNVRVNLSENGHPPVTKDPKMKPGEVADNAIVFLIAGYETTSTMLSYTTYLLAKHQDIQQRLYKEIESHMAGKNEVTLDIVNHMEYLDMVANESLRYYPPVSNIHSREVEKDCEYKGMKFPSDCIIEVPVSYMHYNEKLWPNPKTFDPERFHPDRKKDIHIAAFLPFGIGPRHCIGMRFALMEAKLALVRLLLKCRIQTCDLTEQEIKTKESSIVLAPQSGHIYLTCTPRHTI